MEARKELQILSGCSILDKRLCLLHFIWFFRYRPYNIIFQRPEQNKNSTKKAWKWPENILPQFLPILIIIGLVLAILSPETITVLLRTHSGIWDVLGAAIIGSITLIPGFVAFPLVAALLKNGAGYMQITAFVSTLMMVE